MLRRQYATSSPRVVSFGAAQDMRWEMLASVRSLPIRYSPGMSVIEETESHKSFFVPKLCHPDADELET